MILRNTERNLQSGQTTRSSIIFSLIAKLDIEN